MLDGTLTNEYQQPCLKHSIGKVANMSHAYSVIGMHKSGTTLVAQMLHVSGIPMVEEEDQRSYDEGNHYERKSTNDLNKALLDCENAYSLEVLDHYVPSDKDAHFLNDALATIASASKSGTISWGLKDPRCCLTHSFWKQLIPNVRVICIYRSAASVLKHYSARGDRITFKRLRALRAWAVYNLALIDIYGDTKPNDRIILSYESLLGDEMEFVRLSRFVGQSLEDRRVSSLNRRGKTWGLREKCEAALVKILYGLDIAEIGARLEQLHEMEVAQRCRTEMPQDAAS